MVFARRFAGPCRDRAMLAQATSSLANVNWEDVRHDVTYKARAMFCSSPKYLLLWACMHTRSEIKTSREELSIYPTDSDA